MTDWDAIVARESDAVWRTLWRLLGNRSDVEDCFQETFAAALSVAERESISNWKALLCRIATARAIDRLRQRYRQSPVRQQRSDHDPSVECIGQDTGGPVDTAIATELATRMRAALAEIPEQHAQVFAMFAIHGRSQREIADQLGLTENHVSVTVHRARARLKQFLEGEAL